MNFIQRAILKHTFSKVSKLCSKLIEKGKSFDLDKDGINDLQQAKNFCDNALKHI